MALRGTTTINEIDDAFNIQDTDNLVDISFEEEQLTYVTRELYNDDNAYASTQSESSMSSDLIVVIAEIGVIVIIFLVFYFLKSGRNGRENESQANLSVMSSESYTMGSAGSTENSSIASPRSVTPSAAYCWNPTKRRSRSLSASPMRPVKSRSRSITPPISIMRKGSRYGSRSLSPPTQRARSMRRQTSLGSDTSDDNISYTEPTQSRANYKNRRGRSEIITSQDKAKFRVPKFRRGRAVEFEEDEDIDGDYELMESGRGPKKFSRGRSLGSKGFPFKTNLDEDDDYEIKEKRKGPSFLKRIKSKGRGEWKRSRSEAYTSSLPQNDRRQDLSLRRTKSKVRTHLKRQNARSMSFYKKMNERAALTFKQGDLEEASQLYEENVAIQREELGPKNPITLNTIADFALVLKKQGHAMEARPLFKEAINGFREAMGPIHGSTLSVIANYASFLKDQRRYKDAMALYDEAVNGAKITFGPHHPTTLKYIDKLEMMQMRDY